MMDAAGRQVGIVSLGDGGARPVAFGVYTRVSTLREWIEETICAGSTVHLSSPLGTEELHLHHPLQDLRLRGHLHHPSLPILRQ